MTIYPVSGLVVLLLSRPVGELVSAGNWIDTGVLLLESCVHDTCGHLVVWTMGLAGRVKRLRSLVPLQGAGHLRTCRGWTQGRCCGRAGGSCAGSPARWFMFY